MAGPEDGDKRRDKESHYRRAAVLHPLRRRILGLLGEGDELGIEEIAAELELPLARVAHHVRVLLRRSALRVVPRCRPNPARFRQAPNAEWARKMLDEIDDQDARED
jgi:DNA-binding transcriptional ArsR family regulator